MRTTIDAGGRVVVPKSVRDAMGLEPGREVDVVYADGRIEIELVPAEVEILTGDGGGTESKVPTITPREPLPELTAEQVRDALEATRR